MNYNTEHTHWVTTTEQARTYIRAHSRTPEQNIEELDTYGVTKFYDNQYNIRAVRLTSTYQENNK